MTTTTGSPALNPPENSSTSAPSSFLPLRWPCGRLALTTPLRAILARSAAPSAFSSRAKSSLTSSNRSTATILPSRMTSSVRSSPATLFRNTFLVRNSPEVPKCFWNKSATVSTPFPKQGRMSPGAETSNSRPGRPQIPQTSPRTRVPQVSHHRKMTLPCW
ncbi:MAG TPA: hypothetical protein HA343_02665 [Methanomassiliicoccales archaeon]|nr:hypothetical protein [Methanomassiliicoccales archaeon]